MCGQEIAALLERVHVGLRAIGQTALRAQDVVETVAPLAAQNPDGEVDGHVVRMLARNADVADPDFGLHRVRLVDHDQPPRRHRAAR